MQLHRAEGSAIARLFSGFLFATVASLAFSGTSVAADHKVSPQTAKFDCSRVKPGDTVTLPSGDRGPLKIQNCKGTEGNRIVVRNDPDGNGPAVIRRTSGSDGGFIFDCTDCTGVDIDGSYKWRGAPGGKTYGIKFTITSGKGPSVFVRISGTSKFLTIRNIEIDGAWPKLAGNGSGIRINDNRVTLAKHPGQWREGILIEDTYIHDVSREGMYVGPNFKDRELPLRDIEIRHNLLEDIGYDAINTKSMLAGNNSIHHNVVRRAGKNTQDARKSSQYSGIKNMSGTVKIYNNWVDSTGQHGIISWTQDGPKSSENKGPFAAQIWNNVVVDAGGLWRSFMGKSFAIKVGAESGLEKPVPFVYSNTIVNSRHGAINVGSNVGSGFVRDNIAAGSGDNPVISAPGFVELTNNRVGSVADMGFVDPGRGKFRLKSGSPARNEGSSDYPPIDFDDVRRPKDGAADQGAYEGSD
jgi:hypothetical protein